MMERMDMKIAHFICINKLDKRNKLFTGSNNVGQAVTKNTDGK